ncbi:MAG: energy transducer TonB [Longimonas sp.]|uniref:energy transducer TonB n=1 Tax=Longimonas sp. TaxID=2039626 RepID=UPI003974E9C6
MASRKKPGADLRRDYPLYVQVGMVITLVILVTAFNVSYDSRGDFQVQLEEQDVVEMEEIKQTEQERTPPPPPRPPVPVEVPNDEVVEDQEVDWDSSLDFDEELDSGPPPDEGGEEEEEEQEIFVAVEESPELIGGMDALYEEVEYPDFARRAGIEGRVVVQFVVDEEGNVTDPRALSSPHSSLEEEAIRAVSEMKFEPGKQRDRAVRVQMSLPVMFELN